MAGIVVSLTNPQIAALGTQIVIVYRDAFIRPPYGKQETEVSDFAQSIPDHMEREAFRFVGAFENSPEQLVGFAYGYGCTPRQWWYQNVRQALPLQAASDWLQNSFQLVEIAVSPQAQGRGIGGKLHDHLLNGLPHDRAILSTLQADTVAYHLYRNRGWEVLSENLFFPGVERPYQIMGFTFRTEIVQLRNSSEKMTWARKSTSCIRFPQ